MILPGIVNGYPAALRHLTTNVLPRRSTKLSGYVSNARGESGPRRKMTVKIIVRFVIKKL